MPTHSNDRFPSIHSLSQAIATEEVVAVDECRLEEQTPPEQEADSVVFLKHCAWILITQENRHYANLIVYINS